MEMDGMEWVAFVVLVVSAFLGLYVSMNGGFKAEK